MRANKLLHKVLNISMDNRRLSCLIDVVETAISSKSLAVTSVGRHMKNTAQTRSNIRKVDRLYSNIHLELARNEIYKNIADFLIKVQNPIISIDGTKILNTEFYSLRASLYAEGRGITIYEEVYTRQEYGSQRLYKRFLKNLSSVIPSHSKPILVSDAEFRGPWFKLVLEENWDFVGRLRANRKCSLSGDSDFYDVCCAKVKADSTPRYLGSGYINKQNPLAGNFYTYHKPSKGRHAHTRSGGHSETEKSQKHALSAEAPWFLFSSLKKPPKRIIKLYATRMSIEENFRDTKSERYGLSLNMTRTKSRMRCSIMLIVAALASVVAYLIGCAAEMKGYQRMFQANSIRSHRVLSRFFLGCQVLYRDMKFLMRDINEAIKKINLEMELNT